MAISTGIQNKAAISAISLLDKRDILKKFIDTQNEEGLTDIMQLAGRLKPTTQAIYHDYSEDPLYELLDTTGATVTGSGTTTVTTTCTVATSGYAVKGDLILFPNALVGQISNVSTSAGQDTLTIKSVSGENLTHVAGDKLSPFSNAAGEASTNPTNRKYGFTKYFNLVQQFRGVNEITDIQMISDIEVPFEGSNYIWNHDIASKFIKFKADINAAFIFGRQSATKFSDASPSLVDPVGGGAEQTTMGLNQYATTYGVVGNVASLGTVAMTDFENYLNSLIAARAPYNYFVWGSSKALAKVSNCLKALGSGGPTSAKLTVDGKDLDFDVEKFSYMGFTMQFGVLPIFNHPVIASQTSVVKNLFFVPEGKAPTRDGQSEDYISVRYMKNPISGGFGNDIYAEWDEGALARGGAIGSQAIRRTNWLSTQGLHCVGATRFGKWQVLS